MGRKDERVIECLLNNSLCNITVVKRRNDEKEEVEMNFDEKKRVCL